MNNNFTNIPLGKFLSQVERFETRQELEEYHFAGTYSFGRGIFAGDIKSGSTFRLDRVQRVHEGDFVYCKIMAWEGAFGIVPKEAHNCVMSGAFIAYEINSKIIDSKYLSYYFRMESAWKRIASQSTGTNIRRQSLHPKNFEKSTIPLPPLEEQRRIVGRIEELAGKIAEARGLRDRSIDECGLLLRSSVKAVIYNESTRQTLKPLKDLVTIKGGGTPSKQNPMFWKGSIPWISAKDIKKREVHNSIDHISEDALNNSSTKMIEAGAVIVVTRGMILAHTFPSTILRIPATINQDLKALIPSKEISSEYLSHVLWALNDSILELVEKSTHDTRKLETPKLLNFEIPVPQLQEQQHIVTYLDELQSKVDTMKRLRQESLKELDALLPAILDKAFKGEL